MVLIGIATLTLVSIVAFVRSNRLVNKGGILLLYGIGTALSSGVGI